MIALVFFVLVVGALAFMGWVSASDMRPQSRPPEWSVGALLGHKR